MTDASSFWRGVRAVMREPLLLFAIGGALLFTAYHHYAPRPPLSASKDIVVTFAQLEALRRQLTEVNQRAPTDAELAAAIEDEVDTEVLYREAIALGLDAGDTVVRRRMEQKMRFLIEDTTRLPPASDAELMAYLEAHRADFDDPARVGLTHVFLSRDLHGERTEALAATLHADLLARAATPAQAEHDGDAFPAGFELDLMSERELVRYFGAEFAAAVMSLPVAGWSAPIASAHGVHVVWVRERIPEHRATLDEVRDRVGYAYDQQRQQAANAARLADIRARYTIEIPSLSLARAP